MAMCVQLYVNTSGGYFPDLLTIHDMQQPLGGKYCAVKRQRLAQSSK